MRNVIEQLVYDGYHYIAEGNPWNCWDTYYEKLYYVDELIALDDWDDVGRIPIDKKTKLVVIRIRETLIERTRIYRLFDYI